MKSPWRVNSQRALHGEVNKHRIYLSSSDSETLANVCIHDITRCRGDQLPWRQFAVYLQFLFSAEVFFPSSTLQLGETEAGGATGYVIAADDCNVQSRFCQPDGLTFTSDCMTDRRLWLRARSRNYKRRKCVAQYIWQVWLHKQTWLNNPQATEKKRLTSQ